MGLSNDTNLKSINSLYCDVSFLQASLLVRFIKMKLFIYFKY